MGCGLLSGWALLFIALRACRRAFHAWASSGGWLGFPWLSFKNDNHLPLAAGGAALYYTAYVDLLWGHHMQHSALGGGLGPSCCDGGWRVVELVHAVLRPASGGVGVGMGVL